MLAAGVLVRYLYNYHGEVLAIFRRGKLIWIGLALVLIYPSELLWTPHSKLLTTLIPTFNYLGFAVILFEATQIPFPGLRHPELVGQAFRLFPGKHSYSIYLWHLPVKEWLVDRFLPGPPGWLYLVFFVTASLAVGTFFSEILEMPVLHLRNRLFPATTSRRQPGASPSIAT